MNVRLTIFIVALLVIVGGTFLAYNLSRTPTANPDPPWMYRIDESEMVGITVIHGENRAEYARKPGGALWYIQEEPEIPVRADDDKWQGMPLILSGPRVDRVLTGTVDDAASYGLEPPQTTVQVTQRGGQTLEFHLGYPTPDGRNQYGRLVGDPTLFTITALWGEEINRLADSPPYPRLYYLEAEKLIYVEVDSNGETVKYSRRYRDGAFRWFILDGEAEIPTAAPQWENLPELIAWPTASAVPSLKLEDPAAYGLEPAEFKVRIGREGGGFTEFHLGGLTSDGEHRYSRVVSDDESFDYAIDWLFAMPNEWSDPIIDLAGGE